MKEHKDVYSGYLNLLHSKQEASENNSEIAREVLRQVRKPSAFSFTRDNMTRQYPRNLRLLFEKVRFSDDSKGAISNSERFFLLGSLSEENSRVNRGWLPLLESADEAGENIYFIEQGFLASPESWAPQFRSKPESACLGYVYDDIAQYYMSELPNRLIRKLNSESSIDDSERSRASNLIARITERKISKYNNQPVDRLGVEDSRRKVLVCDQSYADASTVFGLIEDSGFEAMLNAAIAENPDALVIVKTHPDTSWQPGNRSGYFNHLESTGNLMVLRDPVNPYVLFDLVDTVYVGTSQMGLEALLAGKKVVCFGAPFYAGWGITDDRIAVPHRKRSRSLLEIFHFFYIWYTIYHVPGKDCPSTIEDVLDYIELHRPVSVPPRIPPSLTETPDVSVIIPVYGVVDYIEKCIQSAQAQTLQNIEIIPVDDASTDGSAEVIRACASKDPRIRPIFLDKNVGQGFARNAGIERSRGRYIWFLDGDDYFAGLNHLMYAVGKADADTADMVRCRKRIERLENTDGVFVENRLDVTEEYFVDEFSAQTYASCPTLLHNRHFCNFLYRRDFLVASGITFRTPQWEEKAFVLNALINASRISSADSDAFVYRIRTDSTARREKTLSDVEHMVRNFEETMQLLLQHGANHESSPLYEHYCFNGTQFIHFLFYGFAASVLSSRSDRDKRDLYYERIASLLLKSGFSSDCIVATPTMINQEWIISDRYALIVEALRASEFEVADSAWRGEAIDVKFLHDMYRNRPDSRFTAVLNSYASKGMVKISTPHTAEIETSNIRLVLHIGSTKAGSTFLQHWLDRNRPRLLSQGIYYPEFGIFRQRARPWKTAGHSKFLSAAINNDYSLLEDLKSVISHSRGKIHTVLLSSEAFFLNPRATKLCDYFQEFEVEMLVYLRRQDEWANSQYCEFVAGGATARIDSSLENWLAGSTAQRYMSYLRMLDSWEQKISRSNICVRIFEPDRFEGGTLPSDFSRAVGISDYENFADVAARESNQATVSAAYVLIMAHFNRHKFRSKDVYFDFVEDVHTIFRRHNPDYRGSPNLLDTVGADTILEQFSQENSEIADRYLPDVDGSLFSSKSIHRKPLEDSSEAISVCELKDLLACFENYRAGSSKRKNINSSSRGILSYDYGFMDWRRRIFVPILSPLVKLSTSESELQNFKQDPAGFVRSSDTWKTKLARKICFP